MGKDESEAMGAFSREATAQRNSYTQMNLYALQKRIMKYDIEFHTNKNNSISFTYEGLKYIVYAKSNRVYQYFDGTPINTELTLHKFIKFHAIKLKEIDNDAVIISFGKHKLKDAREVVKHDKQYIIWLLKQDWVKSELKEKLKLCLSFQK